VEGFEVVTSDGHKAGHVVEARDGWLVVEYGTLRKTRRAVPREFAQLSDGEQTVRLSVAKHILDDSPKVNGDLDERAAAEYYGIAPGKTQPPTEGYGEIVAGDPAESADQDSLRAGLERPEEQRSRVRSEGGEELESPALLGERTRR
jgi:hypothetical protein